MGIGILSKKYSEMKPLFQYRNGNYTVTLYPDGTKELFTEEDAFHPLFPDSIDLKITARCDLLCPMCHEASLPDGAHGRLDAPFLARLHPGTELAVGGGNPLTHPMLTPFLTRMKGQGVVVNLTVNERHVTPYSDLLDRLIKQDLIKGLGISLSEYKRETFAFAGAYPHAVLHAICGVAEPERLLSMAAPSLKLLLLGYKHKGRGAAFDGPAVARRRSTLSRLLPALAKRYGVLSFDNLALAQLHIRERMAPERFAACYMGGDGESSMYVDLVTGTFGRSSVAEERYPLLSDAEEMLSFLHRNN